MESGLILESHLTDLEIVLCKALTHGDISHPTEWIRGRSATPTIHFDDSSVNNEINSVLSQEPEAVFAVREIAALIFTSDEGGLLVADLWGDTRYKPFTSKKSRDLFTAQTPLLKIADAARKQASITPGSQVIITLIDQILVEVLQPQHRLKSFSSFAVPEVYEIQWAEDENHYSATHARAALRNFQAAFNVDDSAQRRNDSEIAQELESIFKNAC